jgi:hypothetical protein
VPPTAVPWELAWLGITSSVSSTWERAAGTGVMGAM